MGSNKLSSTLELWKRSKFENGLFIALCSKYIYHLSLSLHVLIFSSWDWTEFNPWGGPL